MLSSASTRSLLFMSFIVPIFGQNVPLISPVFLKRALVVPYCCFLLVLYTVHFRMPSRLSRPFFGYLHLAGYTFPSLPCILLLFFLQLFIRPPQITHFNFLLFFFPLGWFCLPPLVQYHGPLSIVLQAHCLQVPVPWICVLPPLHIHGGLDLSHTCLA